ncbi:hypothetical protein F3Y22_tig00111584pilonHSYRG00153 [Hibiscus syriacus]|uniref:RNA-directed DNA polymerase n=1 Tax=Hibiscus syriacus TaxID=106335 RepID=A0A6A2XJY8_HIBSY|nr:hypothetical protein F3Y22_tig00111584pilonHSYRG00153 [Hibiscus syriacus]
MCASAMSHGLGLLVEGPCGYKDLTQCLFLFDQIYEIKDDLLCTSAKPSTEVLGRRSQHGGVSPWLKHIGAQSVLATQRCQLLIEAQRHRGASKLQRMVRTRNGGVTTSHRGVEPEVTEPIVPRMVRTRNGGSTSSHRGVEQEATEPVVQETGLVDRKKLEEIEAALAALRAHMISGDRMRRVDETQEDLLETVTDLGNEVREAIGVIQLGVDVRAKIPDPQRFDEARDVKELENFLFDIEQYFRAMRTESEEYKVAMALMYLDYNTRKKLRELSHTGTIREYVREFSTLMLDIKDMSERDKLFHFLEGLKPWARFKLQRHKVQDLTVAIAAAECLNNYNDHPGKRKMPSTSGANTQQLSNLRKEPERGLMYVDISVNGKTSKALVDTGATDTFISLEEAKRCKLIVTKEVGQMKAVNSAALTICGGMKRVNIKLGSWEGSVDFTVSHMDDFDVVLGLDFMMAAQGEPSFLVFPISKEDDNPGTVPKNIQELLRDFKDVMPGFIRPSKSPFGAPVLFQRKHDGSLRLCVDYRALNKVTVRNKYLIPLIVDLFDQLSNAKYFTKLDIRSGYHQVRVAEGDEPKTACVTRYGAFEFLVMPFGLTNAPATFYTLMNQVFHDYLDKFVVIYLDDIMIFNTSIQEHLEHLRLVLTRLRENQLFVKKEKCAFAQTQVQFLGHIIERGRIRMDKENVKAIQEVKLLSDLLKKGCEWVWSNECQEAFDDLKNVVISEPVLTLPDLEKPLEVETDASDYAIGGVLLQDKHPVAFESRKLNETEARYTAPEKVLLAVIHCLRIWRHYLLGSEFVVKTDNTTAGKKNHVADALSRRADLAALRCVAPISTSRVSNEIRQLIVNFSKQDPQVVALMEMVKRGIPVEDVLLLCWDKGIIGLKCAKIRWITPRHVLSVNKIRFSKYATFVSAPKYCSTEETARLVFKHVVKYWGIPQSIVSDRDGRFIDGQTERFNGLLEEYLSHFIQANQKNWPPLLDVSSQGFHILWMRPLKEDASRASNFMGEWKQNMEIAKVYLEKASKRMKKCADRNRRDLHFQVGDLVLVKLMPEQLRFLRQRDRRLVQKYEGPVSIVSKLFHTDPNVTNQSMPPRESIGTQPPSQQHVDEILAWRIVKVGGKQRREYLVKWGGFDQEENTWEREYDLRTFKQKIEEFQITMVSASDVASITHLGIEAINAEVVPKAKNADKVYDDGLRCNPNARLHGNELIMRARFMTTNKERIERLEEGLGGVQAGMQRMEVLEFPRFSGDVPTEWLNRVDQFFEFQEIAADQKVRLASFHLEGEANQWWQWFRKAFTDKQWSISWEAFEDEVRARYRPPDSEDFDEVLSRALVGTFMGGLKPEVADGIRMFKPQSVKEEISLAKMKDDQFTRQRYRNVELKDYVSTAMKGVNMRREMFEIEEDDNGKEPEITLHALTGWTVPRTMRVKAIIGVHEVVTLIDSGSTHNFFCDRVAKTLHFPVKPTTPFTVRVANEEILSCKGKYDKLMVNLQGNEFHLDFFSMPLNGLDMMLGIQWLEILGSALLEEYSYVFTAPTNLPPACEIDHKILLQDGTKAINARPYRLDLKAGYHQIRVSTPDIPKTAFRTHNGHLRHGSNTWSMSNLHSPPSATSVLFDEKKIDAMVAWPRPSNITKLRGFLGLTGYYRKFVQGYGLISQPLTNLLKKGKFLWNEEAKSAFLALKQAMTSTPTLAMPNFTEPFSIETDASGNGIGVVLTQQNRPISYMIRALGITKQTWSIYAKEMLAIVEAIRLWRPYLLGHKFYIITDQRSLKFFLDQRVSNLEQQKWVAKLLGYDYKIIFRPGRDNFAADALSRRQESPLLVALHFSDVDIWKQIREASKSDSYMQFLGKKAGDPPRDNLTWRDRLLLYKGKVVVPADHSLRAKLLYEVHDSKVRGHSGILRTYRRLQQQFYWLKMHKSVQEYVQKCEVCQRIKPETKAPAGLLQPLPIPALWEDITLDFIEGLPNSHGKDTILVVVDRLSKFIEGVVKLDGMTRSIISDRDPIFISKFWQEFFKLSASKLILSSTYHPQTDGQTEVVNHCVEQYLRCFVHQLPRKWSNYLVWAEYWYNTIYHAPTKITPYQDLYGRLPPLLPAYPEGLSLAHQKLSNCYYGPYPILEKIRAVAYRLQLPPTARIHPVFHVSLLKPYNGTPAVTPLDLPPLVDDGVIPLNLSKYLIHDGLSVTTPS